MPAALGNCGRWQSWCCSSLYRRLDIQSVKNATRAWLVGQCCEPSYTDVFIAAPALRPAQYPPRYDRFLTLSMAMLFTSLAIATRCRLPRLS
jgi:hypothetical protein